MNARSKTVEWHIGYSALEYQVVFVTGACRSGKSWLARLLGSAENVEWLFEPVAIYLPIRLAALEIIDFQYAKSMIRSMCDELVNDRILLRDTNIRFQDMSSIFNYKNIPNLFTRITDINTRSDVIDYLQKKRIIIVFDIPELLPHLDVLKEIFPASKIVHMVRNGFKVVDEITGKGWYALNNLKKDKIMNANVYKRVSCNEDEECFMPYWMGNEKGCEFFTTTDYGRAVMYWSNLLGYAEIFENLIDIEIKYEDLVSGADFVLEKIDKLLPCQWTPKTEEVKSLLDVSYSPVDMQELSVLSEREQYLFYEQMGRYNYV